MDYIYGKLNQRVKLVFYGGSVTETAITRLSDKDNTFSVQVLQTPGSLIVRNPNRDVEEASFNGSSDVIIDIPVERFVRSMTLHTCTEVDKPVAGYKVGDHYLETVFSVAYGEQPAEIIYTSLAALNLDFNYAGSEYIDVDNETNEIRLKLEQPDPDKSLVLKEALDQEAKERRQSDSELSKRLEEAGSQLHSTYGYYYAAIDLQDKVIYLASDQQQGYAPSKPLIVGQGDTTYKLPAFDFVLDWEAGDPIGVNNNFEYVPGVVWIYNNTARVSTAAFVRQEGNAVYYSGDLGFTEIYNLSNWTSKPQEYAVYNPSKPESGGLAGAPLLARYSYSFGRDHNLVGLDAFAAGRGSQVLGSYGVALGRKLKAAYGAFAANMNNNALGSRSAALGDSTESRGYASMTVGQGTIAAEKAVAQFVQGVYNEVDSEGRYIHIVGGGRKYYQGGWKEERKNAYTLTPAGGGWFRQQVKVGGTSDSDPNAKLLATEDRVPEIAQPLIHNALTASNIRGEGSAAGLPPIPGAYVGEARSSKLYAFPKNRIALQAEIDGVWTSIADPDVYKLFLGGTTSYSWKPFDNTSNKVPAGSSVPTAWRLILTNDPAGSDRYVSLNAVVVKVQGVGTASGAASLSLTKETAGGVQTALVSDFQVHGNPRRSVCYFNSTTFGGWAAAPSNTTKLIIEIRRSSGTPSGLQIFSLDFLGEHSYNTSLNILKYGTPYTVGENGKDVTFQGALTLPGRLSADTLVLTRTAQAADAETDAQLTTLRQVRTALSEATQQWQEKLGEFEQDVDTSLQESQQHIEQVQQDFAVMQQSLNNLGRVQGELQNENAQLQEKLGELEQDVAAIPQEVVNITTIDRTYETVADLPTDSSNGTTLLVLSERALYHYSAEEKAWSLKATLRSHTLYCVLEGEKSGIYRYTMKSPYLVLAEQAAIEVANKYTNEQVEKQAVAIHVLNSDVANLRYLIQPTSVLETVETQVTNAASFQHSQQDVALYARVTQIEGKGTAVREVEFCTSWNVLPTSYPMFVQDGVEQSSVTVSGVVCTKLPNGAIQFKGTASQNDSMYLSRSLSLATGWYFLKSNTTLNEGSAKPALYLKRWANDWRPADTSNSFNIQEGDEYYNQYQVYIQLTKDSQYDCTILPFVGRRDSSGLSVEDQAYKAAVLQLPTGLSGWGQEGNVIRLSESGEFVEYYQTVSEEGASLPTPISTNISSELPAGELFVKLPTEANKGVIRSRGAEGSCPCALDMTYQRRGEQ